MAFGNINHHRSGRGSGRVLPAGAVALILVGVLLSVTGCSKQAETADARSKDVICELATATATSVPQYVTATGSLTAEKTVMVSTRMMGWVKKIHVVQGQSVKQGDALLDIDDTDLQAKKAQALAGITEAEAVLANAQKMAERFENLYADKSVSRQQLDDVLTGRDRAAAGVNMAKAGLSEVNVHLSYLNLTAPSDGVVARKMIEEGNMANPGMPLINLEQTDRLKVVAHLSEKDVSAVAAGAVVTVDVTSVADAKYEVVLDRVIPTANQGSRTYDIEAHLDNTAGRLRSGMFARVHVPVGKRNAVLVPADAVIRRGQLSGLWVVNQDDVVNLRWVRLGHERAGNFEVISGLAGGETIVLSAEQPLAEGDRVVR